MTAATMTFVPKEEQSAPIQGVAESMHNQPETGFSLLCPDGAKVPLPEPLARVLMAAAEALMRKNAVTMVVRSAWLTTKEAADMMGYSRQVVVDLIKKNKLKATKFEGTTHRRIKLSDLLEYMNKEDEERSDAFAKLVDMTEEFGGYDLESEKKERK
ncbi:MAG: helix-turn-helix domain-containing protein [Candidatus Obscuribacterales bacterium]|nr:helix-turn-helix domain-containing protein [Candidatus Obscuribacterales bacterium]